MMPANGDALSDVEIGMGARDGVMIALLNPKLEVFMLALSTPCSIDELSSAARAAEPPAPSQSAVSHKAKRLEAELGCDLLNRSAGAPLFTVEGERLRRRARRIFAVHDGAVLSQGQQPRTGRCGSV